MSRSLRDRGQEAEVGHVVGLVQDGDLHLRERADPSLDQVHQPARGRDDDVDAPLEGVDLAPHRRTAVDGGDLHPHRLAQGDERVGDLLGQLTGRHEHEPARRTGPTGVDTRGDPGQHRQAERQGLAGAGLRASEDVASGERIGHRARLDRERRLDAAGGERGDDRSGKAELGERAHGGRRGGEGSSELTVQLGGRARRRPGGGCGPGPVGRPAAGRPAVGVVVAVRATAGRSARTV